MAQPSTSDNHRYHSWGRTRGPKNLARPEKATQAATATAAPTAVTDGYTSENQSLFWPSIIFKHFRRLAHQANDIDPMGFLSDHSQNTVRYRAHAPSLNIRLRSPSFRIFHPHVCWRYALS